MDKYIILVKGVDNGRFLHRRVQLILILKSLYVWIKMDLINVSFHCCFSSPMSSLWRHLLSYHHDDTTTGVYGDVHRVKIMFNKKDNALVQFSDAMQAQTGMCANNFYGVGNFKLLIIS